VNLWAVGKPNAVMSLTGHKTSIECVTFDAAEEAVVAGSQGGTLMMWDLETQKVVRTLKGHMTVCTAVDFHPYGQYFASGSQDTTLRIWDERKTTSVQIYKGHTQTISCIKFSPDGKWVVTGSEDGTVKLWDLTAGKCMQDFSTHSGPITGVDFHPHEFLLATGSQDRTVKFWDVETFKLVSSTNEAETGIRSVAFTPNGNVCMAASGQSVRTWAWEPVHQYDVVDVSWSNLSDMAFSQDTLLGCTLHNSFVAVWCVNLKEVRPFSNASDYRPPTTNRTSAALSRGPPPAPVPNHPDIEDVSALADNLRVVGLRPSSADIPRSTSVPVARISHTPAEQPGPPPAGSSKRTSITPPPPNLSNFVTTPGEIHTTESPKAQASSRTSISSNGPLPRSRSAIGQPPATAPASSSSPSASLSATGHHVSVGTGMGDTLAGPSSSSSAPHPKSSASSATANDLPPASYDRPPSNSPRRPERQLSARRVPTPSPPTSASSEHPPPNMHTLIPERPNAPLGLDINAFLPRTNSSPRGDVPVPATDEEMIGILTKDHAQICSVIGMRLTHLKACRAMWNRGDAKATVETMLGTGDDSTVVDILSVLVHKPSLFNLDIAQMLLPTLERLIGAKFESHVARGIETVALLVMSFSRIILETRAAHFNVGIDLVAEERRKKCDACFASLSRIRPSVAALSKRPGKAGSSARELYSSLDCFAA